MSPRPCAVQAAEAVMISYGSNRKRIHTPPGTVGSPLQDPAWCFTEGRRQARAGLGGCILLPQEVPFRGLCGPRTEHGRGGRTQRHKELSGVTKLGNRGPGGGAGPWIIRFEGVSSPWGGWSYPQTCWNFGDTGQPCVKCILRRGSWGMAAMSTPA